MHAASIALLLHGVLLASLAGLVIRSKFSVQSLLLIGLLVNIHPRLLSYIIPPRNTEAPSHVHDSPSYGEVYPIQTEASPQSNDRKDERHQSIPVSVEKSCDRVSGFTDELITNSLEADSPTKAYLKCIGKKLMRDRGTFDQDKENEPLPLSPLKGRGAAPLSRHHGLRPLTLTNLCLDAKDSLTPRRTVSLFNGAKRLSPLFYVSHGRQERSSLTRSSTELNPRRVSLPPQCLSRIRTDDTTRIQSETHLTSRLEEEMKLTARLRNDLIELQDRACAKLSQSELQVQALAAAVDARECFIKDLAARVELLRVENQVLKKANRRGFCQDVPAEALTASIGEDVPILSPIINTQELGNGMVRLANDKSRQFEPLRSVQERKLGQRYSMGSGIAFRCISSTCGDREMDNISGDPASWFSMGSISEPTLEPRRASAAQIRVSPPAYTFHNAEIGEYAVENGTSLQDIEIQFPTICPDFPPCHAAAFERRKAALPSSSALIYEVDGTALAASRQCNDIHMQDSVCLDSPRLRDPPYCSANDESDSAPLAHNETWFGQGRCLMMQRDSPFYAVPASAFILPRVLPTVSA